MQSPDDQKAVTNPKPFHISLLSERAQKGLRYPSFGAQNVAHFNNPYCSKKNKKGIIKLSSADNVLCEDIIREKFAKIDWTKFDPTNLFLYPRDGGEISTLKCVADFINRYCRKNQKTTISWDNIVLLPGVTTCIDLLGQILFDPGEVLLAPEPYYYRFANDFGERGLVDIVTIPALDQNNNMRTTLKVERFEAAYQKAVKEGKKVRATILTNPQNPEANYFTLEELKPIIEWSMKRRLFVILDEIYDMTIYDEHQDYPFQSACSLFQGEAANYLIWMWGLSKNFSLPGLRFGVLHSPNELIRNAAARFVLLHVPNTTTQFIVRELLSDYDWIDKVFLPANNQRMKSARDHFLYLLDSIKASYIKPRAGFFVMVDFSKYLDELTFDGERRLAERFFANKVMVTPGETMNCLQPGWFRIVFTSVDKQCLSEAFHRMVNTLERRRG